MKSPLLAVLFYLVASTVAAPPSANPRDIAIREVTPLDPYSTLEKRKGGGGGKGGSSGSSSSGGKGGSSSSSSSSGSGSGGRSFSPTSNVGGRTREGSGTKPAYGNRYAGGAAVPYTAGARSPTRGISPYPFVLAGFVVFPGLWLYGSLWAYPYGYPYYWNDNGRNRTSNVTCLCQQYQVCGCDPDGNSTFLNEMVGNGTNAPVNSSLVRTVDYGNGTVSTFINGSLANGTTAPGGTDPSNDSEASAGVRIAINYAGYWLMIATVITGVMVL